jgi:hypothetical protein
MTANRISSRARDVPGPDPARAVSGEQHGDGLGSGDTFDGAFEPHPSARR